MVVCVLWITWAIQAEMGSLGTWRQRLDLRDTAELTAVLFFFSSFLNLPFWKQQRHRAEQVPREQSLVSCTLSFDGLNSEGDLCPGRAETYYNQLLKDGWEGGGHSRACLTAGDVTTPYCCSAPGLDGYNLGWGQQHRKSVLIFLPLLR